MGYEEIVREQMKNVMDDTQTDSLSDYASKLSKGLSDNYTLDKILEATVSGKSIFDTDVIIDSLKTLFLYEVREALVIGVEILGICIIIGMLNNLSSSFGKKGTADIASLICTTVIIGLAINSFNTAFQLTSDTIKTISGTMEIILPVLIGILIAMGQIASGTIMSPLILTAVTVFQVVIKRIVLPGIFLSGVLGLINCLTEKDYVSLLSKFLRRVSVFITGIMMTILSGIIAVQGLIAKTSDSLIVGTAKYSIDEFIPIVGGFTADTIELFLKCMNSIKGVVGIFGIITISVLMLAPIIKILAVAVIYKITALLTEAVASKKLAEAIDDTGTALIYMGSILFLCSLLFIVFITSIIKLGGTG